jgi:RNA polymerase-binding transcription factor DksA
MIGPDDNVLDVDVYDETDYAQRFDLNWTAKHVENVRKLVKTNNMTPGEIANLIARSPKMCEECDDPINEQRRVLEPGTKYCTDCQEFLDKKNKINGVRH